MVVQGKKQNNFTTILKFTYFYLSGAFLNINKRLSIFLFCKRNQK
jgi:hypothetical protein